MAKPRADPDEVLEGKPTIIRVVEELIQLAASDFHGSVTIHFQAGHVQRPFTVTAHLDPKCLPRPQSSDP